MEGVRAVPELRGIIPNSFAHIFGHIAKAEGDKRSVISYSEIKWLISHFIFHCTWTIHLYDLTTFSKFYRFLVTVSYLEIYNEEVRNLLGKDQNQRLEVNNITMKFWLPSTYLLILCDKVLLHRHRWKKDQMLVFISKTSPVMLYTTPMTWTGLCL